MNLELEKHEEPINPTDHLLNKLKDLEKKFNDLKDEMNQFKLINSTNKGGALTGDEKIKLINEIKANLNLSEKIKEILQDENIKDKLFKEFEEKISKTYIKKEKEENQHNKDDKDNNKLISEKVEESINKIINEKLVNKVDEKVFKESLNKIKKDIEKQVNTINDMKNNIVNKEILKKEINEYDIKKI